MRTIIAAVLALACSVPAHAEISRQMSMMYCAAEAEMRATVKDFRPIMRGKQGAKDHGGAELLYNQKTGEWFMLQLVPDKGLACIVIGGNSIGPVDQKKEGSPS